MWEMMIPSSLLPSSSPRAWRALELYSGIGGMHYASLAANERLTIPINIVAAFEISHLCNAVYEHNFNQSPLQLGIQGLSMDQLLSYHAEIWLMSPPCQPYTRAGKQQDMEDERASSFIHLCHLLEDIHTAIATSTVSSISAPSFILLENVQSFERSQSCHYLLSILRRCHYDIQQMILTPLQIRIPNQRSRYFLLARKKRVPTCSSVHRDISRPSTTSYIQNHHHNNEPTSEIILHYIPNNPHFITHHYHLINRHSPLTSGESESIIELGDFPCYPLSDYLDNSIYNDHCEILKEYRVPQTILAKPTSYCYGQKNSNIISICFTKAYHRYARGTGSLLQLHSYAHDTPLIERQLRYFTPTEIARLHGFPVSTKQFTFPASISKQQQYALLGNSLNVTLVAELLLHLLEGEFVT